MYVLLVVFFRAQGNLVILSVRQMTLVVKRHIYIIR
jgi:hypothetical protein